MVTTWVYRKTDGVFLYGGSFVGQPLVNDVLEGIATFDEVSSNVNPITERYDPTSLTKRRLATAQELIDAGLATADAAADAAARQKDLLAMLATVAEAYNATWATMTNAQRKTEVSRLAARWGQWRRWIERNSF